MSHNHMLREMAKFFSGLILGDFICGWWLYASHNLPISFLGITATQSSVVPWMIFDAALFIILVHYAWHIGRTPTISKPAFFHIVGTILGVVALAHFIRLFFGTDIIIAGWTLPLWLSWIGTVAAAYLSYMSFRLGIETKK